MKSNIKSLNSKRKSKTSKKDLEEPVKEKVILRTKSLD